MFKVVKCLLSDRLRMLDMNQQQLSERSRIPKSQISEYINNKHVMSLDSAKTISHILECDIEDLYQWKSVVDDKPR